MPDAREVEIDSLGAQGDGVAATDLGSDSGPLYVAYALPGELWRVADGRPGTLLRPHPARATPACCHFGSCGGCVAQHMPDDLYVAWKQGIVAQAFRHRGIEAPMAPLVRTPSGSRRRVTLAARRDRDGLVLGFHKAGTHDILDIAECPIAVPAIVAALPALREMLAPVLAGKAEAAVTVLATPAGLDVAVALDGSAGRGDLAHLPALAARHGFARVTVNGEPAAAVRRPVLGLGGVDVEPPSGAFVQAVEAAEQAMVGLILEAVDGARHVADLFCGLGTFTFPLARRARVLAVDSDPRAIGALVAAVRRTQGLKPVETKVRDLFRVPLSALELEPFDAVVFDPARSGAREQAAEIAKSQVPAVVAVSCNPATLARDVRLLLDGGYTLERVTPIDQFLYSPHVEAVAVLRRQRLRSRGRKRPTRAS